MELGLARSGRWNPHRVRVAKEVVIATWGLIGVLVILGRALAQLTTVAVEPIRAGQLDGWHWVVLATWVLVNAYAEGYRGFHLRFSPRTVDRAIYLGRHPTLLRVLLAPLFCMGLFAATRRTLIVSWGLVAAIVVLVVGVRQLAQPWRGIIDAGVVVGLGLGVLSLVGLFVLAIVQRREPVLHEVPSARAEYSCSAPDSDRRKTTYWPSGLR